MRRTIRSAVSRSLGRANQNFRRLISDQHGNAMIIAAAAVIPIVACLGGGLDIARAYVVKSRLSEACDASALAGRRTMVNEDIATAQPEALKFFNFNFPKNYLGSTSFVPDITHPDMGVVAVSASTNTPTTLMRIFGFDSIPVHVDCKATQNFENIDIVLVLDNTGSMADTPSGTYAGDSDPTSKIYGLRRAVMALYDQLASAQAQLAAQGLRLRYGIVPYSSSVNVGKLIYAENPNYMVTGNWTYDSRVPNFTSSWWGTSFSGWTYQPVSYSLSSFVSGGTLTTPTGDYGSNISMSWAGCIEERQTSASIGSSTSTAPSDAYDHNIDLIPYDDSTRWKPYLSDVHGSDPSDPSTYLSAEYYRDSPGYGWAPQKACPQQSARLANWARADLQSYVDSLFSDGGTYHDLGMLWGIRMISPSGIFGPENPSTYNGRPVHRFIIYMTDGMLDTGNTLYSSYGIEQLDKRVTGGFTSKSDQDSRHRQRFLLACTAAKKMGVSIWTIVFASGEDTTLKSCASSADQYSLSASSADLINKFSEIGKNIGALRLSK